MISADVQTLTAETAAGGAAIITVLRMSRSLAWHHFGLVREGGQVVVNAVRACRANPGM
jgi:hypothetical protein